MSEGMNKVILLGNLGADPELRYTAAGTAMLKLRLATNETWLDKNRETQERVEWHSVVVWGARAEGLSRILSKGASVLIEGGLRTTSYEKDGQKHYRTEVHARDIFPTGRRAAPTVAPMADPDGDPGDSRLEPPPLPPVRAPARANGAAARKPEPMEELPF